MIRRAERRRGTRKWRIGDLTHDQRKLPIRQVVNDTYLIDMIETGLTPETDSS
jgi:hypothetical protein